MSLWNVFYMKFFKLFYYKHAEKSPCGLALCWSFRRVREKSKYFAFLYGKKRLQKTRIRATVHKQIKSSISRDFHIARIISFKFCFQPQRDLSSAVTYNRNYMNCDSFYYFFVEKVTVV